MVTSNLAFRNFSWNKALRNHKNVHTNDIYRFLSYIVFPKGFFKSCINVSSRRNLKQEMPVHSSWSRGGKSSSRLRKQVSKRFQRGFQRGNRKRGETWSLQRGQVGIIRRFRVFSEIARILIPVTCVTRHYRGALLSLTCEAVRTSDVKEFCVWQCDGAPKIYSAVFSCQRFENDLQILY